MLKRRWRFVRLASKAGWTWLVEVNNHLGVIVMTALIAGSGFISYRFHDWWLSAFVVALLVLVTFGEGAFRTAHLWDEHANIVPVVGKKFINEVVPLDGFSYSACDFTNPTFRFVGERPFHLTHNNIHGSIQFDFGPNVALGVEAKLLKELGVIGSDVDIQVRES